MKNFVAIVIWFLSLKKLEGPEMVGLGLSLSQDLISDLSLVSNLL